MWEFLATFFIVTIIGMLYFDTTKKSFLGLKTLVLVLALITLQAMEFTRGYEQGKQAALDANYMLKENFKENGYYNK